MVWTARLTIWTTINWSRQLGKVYSPSHRITDNETYCLDSYTYFLNTYKIGLHTCWKQQFQLLKMVSLSGPAATSSMLQYTFESVFTLALQKSISVAPCYKTLSDHYGHGVITLLDSGNTLLGFVIVFFPIPYHFAILLFLRWIKIFSLMNRIS